VAFIAAAGLAIQVGDTVVARATLRAAIDLGTIKGASMMLNGQSDGAAEAAAERIAEFNLRLNGDGVVTVGAPTGSTPPPAYVNATIVNPTARLRLEGGLRRPIFLLRVLPGVESALPFAASSQGSNAPLNIVVVLDHSGSMQSNSVTPNPPIPGQPTTATRFYWAKWALKNFVIPELRSGDQFGVVRFSTGAWPTVPSHNRPTTSVYPVNPPGGFGVSPVINRANRGATIAAATAATDAIPTPDGYTNIPDGFRAAQLALQTAVPGITRRLVVILISDGAASLPNDATLRSVAESTFTACEWSVTDLNPSNVSSSGWYRLLKVTALRAVAAADQLRAQGALVHTIGFTSGSALLDQNTTTEFQDYWSSNGLQLLKPIFLARTANYQTWMEYPPPPFQRGGIQYPWNFPCVATGSSQRTAPAGQYVSAIDPNQIRTALKVLLAAVRVKLEE